MGAQRPASNENLVEKYKKYSHDDLYKWLKAGDPNQVDGLLDEWKKIVDGTHDMSTNLDTELETLGGQWTSASGDEFDRRMGKVSSFANNLSIDIGTFRTTLQSMSTELRNAQKQNEDPENTDDNDSTVGGAVVGYVVAGPVGGLVGGIMGHNRDKEQREQAKNRMVQLVAGLAGEYQTGEYDWTAPPIDPELPGDDVQPTTDPTKSADPGSGTSATPTIDPTAHHDNKDPKFDVHRPDAPDIGTSNVDDGTGDGGRVDMIGSNPNGSSLAGAGGGGPSGAGVGTGTGLASAPSGASAGGAGGGFAPVAAGGGGGGRVSSPGGTGSRRSGEDDVEEYSTWLTEDDEVWGGDQDAASGLLGGRPANDKS
ncbi:MAG TPA: hypothetical protein VGN37_20370 [Actinocatenispora sp.]